MDNGHRSPIEFVDQLLQDRLNNNSRSTPNSVGALSSRLSSLRPVGSVPFTSRTSSNKMLHPNYDNSGLMDGGGGGGGYGTMPNIPNKSLSSQNIMGGGGGGVGYQPVPIMNPRATMGMMDHQMGSMMNSTGTYDRPRPSSARDPNWAYDPHSVGMGTYSIPPGQSTAPRPLKSQQPAILGSNRYRNNRSSSFDQERPGVDGPINSAGMTPSGISNTAGPLPPNQRLYHHTPDYSTAALLGTAGGPVTDLPPTNSYLLDPYTPSGTGNTPGMDPTFLLTRLQQELDLTKEKLASQLNSIKTFWSPELKRERALRKEENAKYVLLAEELHQLQMEKKSMLSNIHQLETDLRKEKELRSRHNQTAQELDLLYRRCEELEKENRVIAKQAEENDRRAQFQKDSLITAEENIRKLLEVVKAAKSGNAQNLQHLKLDKFEETQMEIERLRSQLHDYSNRIVEMERVVVDKEFENNRNKEQLDILNQDNQALRQENESIRQEIQQTQTLQSLVDTKESKILTLENEIRLLEDELARIRDEELITPTASINGIDDYEKSMRNPAGMRPHERLLKSKMETMNIEISKRDSEIYSLQSRLEMAEKQHQDQNHHINVLKEQVKTREHKISMLMADVEDFRKRLKEKENLLEKKSQILTCSQSEKHQTESEIIELKDQCEMKDKKISLLQRKVENLEDLLNDKDNQLSNAKTKLTTLHSDYTSTEGTKVNLEEALRDKDRQIERLKETKVRLEHEFQDELEMQKKQISETKSRLENSERELREKATMLNEMREELSEIRAAKFKRDSENNTLQVQLSQRVSEVTALQLELERMKKQYQSDTEYKMNHRVSELESQVNHYSESATRLQGEVDRLLTLARNLEGEKLDKDRNIHNLESQIKEHQLVISNLKRTQQNDKSYMSEEIEALKRREENVSADMEVVKSSLQDRDGRIKELEQALRESMKISADRESYVHTQEDSCKMLETQVLDQKQTLEHVQKERNELSQQVTQAQDELRDKEAQLKTIEGECFNNYIPELDRQRKSNQELVLRVQALVKLVQGREFQLSEAERISLAELGLYPDGTLHTRVGGYPGSGRISAGPYTSSAIGGMGLGSRWGGGAAALMGAGGLPTMGGGLHGSGSNPHLTLPGALPSAFHSTGIIPTDEVSRLTRLLHDKEQMLHQQMEDISRLRIQNSDLESKMKTMEGRLSSLGVTNPSSLLLGANKYIHTSTGMTLLTSQSNAVNTTGLMGSSLLHGGASAADMANLRQLNTELTSRVTYLKNLLDEKEEKLKNLTNESNNNFLQMEIERIKRETNASIAEKDSHISLLASEVDKAKKEKAEVGDSLMKLHTEIKEKSTKISFLESEQSKVTMDKESMQKKYQTALSHLSEKTEKIQTLERECYQKQVDEIKRLKQENEESAHRLSFMSKSLTDRDSRVEQLEKEHYKLRDEVTSIQKQLHTSESEVKRLREELTYREQRIKSMQSAHTEEINQLRNANHENNARVSQMRQSIEEKDQIIKTKFNEMDKYKTEYDSMKRRLREKENDTLRISNELAEKDVALKNIERDYNDEIQRYQKANEDATSRLGVIQKRVDERETRLRKIEQENNELLDEIHTLRKRNHEIESNLDLLRQQVIDKDDPVLMATSTSRSSSTMDMGYYSSQVSTVQTTMLEIEKMRKQYHETLNLNSQLQKTADEASLQIDRIAMDRDMHMKKYEDIKAEYDKLSKSLATKEHELKSKELEFVKKSSDESSKLSQQNNELMQIKRELVQEIENRDMQIAELSREIEKFQKMQIDVDTNFQGQSYKVKEMQGYIDQLIHERDDARLIASSTTGFGSSSYRMNMQENQRIMQQQMDKVTIELDKSQKEVRDLRTRNQELTRQLKETQTNWENTVKERDSLRQQLNNRGRESQITQLSKEMERMLRQEQDFNQKLEQSEKKNRDQNQELLKLREEINSVQRESRQKAEKDRAELERTVSQLERLQGDMREMHEQNERREEEISNSQQEESEKLKHQYSVMSKKYITLQHEYETKERQIQQLTETLEQIRKENTELQAAVEELHVRNQQVEYDLSSHAVEKEKWENDKKELEGWVGQMKEALDNKGSELANLQQASTRRKSVEIQQMNMQSQNMELKEQLELKEKQLDEANRQLDNASQEIQEQEYLIQELSQKLDTVQFDTNSNQHSQMEPSHNMMNSAEIDSIKKELSSTRQALDEKTQRVHLLETECFQQQADEIERLRKELRSQQQQQQQQQMSMNNSNSNHRMSQHGIPNSYSNNDIQSLKMEVDSLKREVNTKNDQLEKHERECQEKHLRRIDALQLKLKRSEEEITHLEKQLEEMRRGVEEREKMLKQVKMNQHQATSVELEKLREEYNRCQDDLGRRTNQIKTLEKQINSQIKEILEIKQEALTASICEKDANLALLQMTGANNSHAQQAMQKLSNEKSQLQSQLKQLSSTRQKLQEEQNQ